MARRILILIGAHLSTAPRAQKEALALREAGHDVEISGVWFSEEAAAADLEMASRLSLRFTPALDFRGHSSRGALRRAYVRARARWARWRFARRNAFSPRLLGYGAPELLRHALRRAADLTIVHSEAGLWVGSELIKRGHHVGMDFEDWFSRDLPNHARRERPVAVLEELEREVARAARYVLAPSRAMSLALAKAYAIPPPTVIYNVFPRENCVGPDGKWSGRRENLLPSIHWFSQTIGPDRGLELLFAALPLVRNRAQVHLRGACSKSTHRWLAELIPPSWKDSVMLLPLVPSTELSSRIAEHDVGFALETDQISSRDLTVSNKLFQYLQAGLAVIGTPTQGQREVLDQCGEAGTILADFQPATLAAAIDRYLENAELLAHAKRAALAAAAGIFAWENYKGRIIEAAEAAFRKQ